MELLAESLARLRNTPALRRSLAIWSGAGLAFTSALAVPVALLHRATVESAGWALLGTALWWAVVSAVLLAGAAGLRTPPPASIMVDHYGIPNGLTALRAYACLPLMLMAALALPGRSGLALWGGIGFTTGMLDAVDGIIARRIGPVTELGRALDPASDALFFAVAGVGNVLLGILPPWIGVLTLVRYLGPLLLTPVVFLLGRRPELVHTTWGRRNTALTGLVMFCCLWVRILNGPVGTVATVLAVPLLVPTTALHFWSLAERAGSAPSTGRRLSGPDGGVVR